MAIFDRPIPGQSLTSEPKGKPYERPPEITDPEEALMVHLERLNDVDRLEGAMFLLQKKMTVRDVTEGILRSAVAEGIHSVDVSLSIAPVIHEFIAGTADAIGMDYRDGFETDEERKRSGYQMEEAMAQDILKEMGMGSDDSPSRSMSDEEMPMEESAEMPADTEMSMEDAVAQEAPAGLMARR